MEDMTDWLINREECIKSDEKINIENLIEQLTKVRPEMLNKEALKLFNTIMAVLDERDRLREKNTYQSKTIIELEEQIKYYANEINEIANELEKDGFVGYADEIRDLCIIQDELMEG